ncbi:hypothetical protein FQN49_008128, partial [Arthroderma sp. PD_2]
MGDWWTEFSNNLATDLAPLISLFGEAPTKQYLSECLNITDIIIFAMAPLGIITTIVSAIRVCGTPSLRAFVGRAQEGAGNAEAELCSSTSREICELYNNGGIARVFGRPKLLEIVHDPNATNDEFHQKGLDTPATAGIYSFKDYLKKDKQEWEEIDRPPGDEEKVSPQSNTDKERNFAPNPNLSLNVGIKQGTKHWFTAAAILGVILQSGVLIWATLARYTYAIVKKDLQDLYAVPLTVIGTFLLCTGVALCASLIERSTKERVFKRETKKPTSQGEARSQIYWVQPGTQFVGDQAFDSFAYTHPKDQFTRYITSWKTGKSERERNGIWVWGGITCTALGFLLQFLGLRACHSSVAVVQLGVTIVMSVVRSMLRANRLNEEEVSLAHNPDLYQGHELDWLALNLGTDLMPKRAGDDPGPKWMISSAQFQGTVDISETGWKLLGQNTSTQTPSFPNEHTEFRKMSVSCAGCCLLSGFRLDCCDLRGSQDQQNYNQHPEDWWEFHLAMDSWQVDVKFSPERWRTRFQSKSTDANLKRIQNNIEKAFLYRARLARLANGWDERLVGVRSISRALAKAVEATMHAFVTTDVRFEKGWDAAFTLFWAVKCSHDKGETTEGNIYLSLKREIDKDGRSEGIWRVDESELEAVLGLWLWSLRSIGAKSQTPLKRILSVKPDSATETDPARDFDLWREGGGSSIEVTESQRNPQQLPLFGWHNVPAKYPIGRTTLKLPVTTRSLSTMCAQEIYSLFFTSMVHIIKDIGGKTEVLKSSGFSLTNTNISKIQEAFTESGLGSVGDAFTCIFPALINQKKLPSVLETLSSAREAADAHIDEARWEEAEKLLLWALPHSISSIPGQDQISDAKLINQERLLTLSLCECYRKALLDGEIEFCLSGILKLLNKTTLRRQENILLIAEGDLGEEPSTRKKRVGRENGPEGATKKPLYTLADTVRSYGRAAFCVVHSKGKDNAAAGVVEKLASELLAELNDKGTPVQTSDSKMLNQSTVQGDGQDTMPLSRAIRDGKLDSVLSLLNQKSTINDNKNGGSALLLAAQNGWYTVVKALIDYGATLEKKDIDDNSAVPYAAQALDLDLCRFSYLPGDGRSAISYAAQSGDINTFDYLLGKGAFPNFADNYRQTPLFYAARFGNLAILKRLLADGRVEPDSKNKNGRTPLSLVAENGDDKVVKLLLAKKGVEADLKGIGGKTPLL